ncbi:MAG: glycosyltransferase [Candidatus Diapherotrites archaeon]|nr:glycosyltransferase [Candidatus Diapherotrites archaeon]
MPKSKALRVSAIVPVYNAEKYIAKCLHSLLNQTRQFDEIIVVDDGSTDNSLQIVKNIAKKVRSTKIKIIELEHGERSRARNIGAKNTDADIICFAEADCIYNKRWLEFILKEFSKGKDAVADELRVYKPRTFIGRLNQEFNRCRFKRYKPFAAWCFRREVFLKLKGFDEKLSCAEDLDIAIRLKNQGFKLGFAKGAIKFHANEPQSIGDALQRSFNFGKNIIPFYQKHPQQVPIKKLALFSVWPLTIFFTPLFLLFFLAIYFYVFFKFASLGMKTEFLLLLPFYVMITELAFTFGFWYGSIIKLIGLNS